MENGIIINGVEYILTPYEGKELDECKHCDINKKCIALGGAMCNILFGWKETQKKNLKKQTYET